MGVASRARRLFLSRGLGAAPAPTGLVWVGRDPDFPALDPASLPEGSRVVFDYWVIRNGVAGDVSVARWRERVAHGAGDFGFVLAWDGTVVGSVRGALNCDLLLDYEWPEGLACERPVAAAAPDGLLSAAVASRAADERRVAAELRDAEASAEASSPRRKRR